MYLQTKSGIVETPKFSRFKSVFCKHRNTVIGTACSKNGLMRISGSDQYLVCTDCGRTLNETHFDYDM